FMDKKEQGVYLINDLLINKEFKDMNDFINRVSKKELDKIEDKILEGDDASLELEQVKLLSPIPKPLHDIICLGVNYEDHLKESKAAMGSSDFDKVQKPVYFSKRAIEIAGSGQKVKGFFNLDKYVDYEVELAIIIGKKGRNIKKKDAEEYIFGYSVFNDLSSRKLQKDHTQWYKGKSLDLYSIMGPSILHKRALPFPIAVDVVSRVNGEIRQNGNTNMLIHDIPSIIEDFSKGITIEPGDIIITGTPAGVGMGFDPPRYLKAGDIVECEIKEIGTLVSIIE
ncbi:MAG: fumarylacetoacetate hydrolase family protein, partial [Tissierellia bacterium]|nr:fumarylacetoacetate hydrolase family protein [Tissierellia bacterium]